MIEKLRQAAQHTRTLLRRGLATMLIGTAAVALIATAHDPVGLASRAVFKPYNDNRLPSTAGGAMPLLLSQTGVFDDTANRVPHAGLVPYDLNAPLWSDGSLKQRWIGIPFDGTIGSPGSPKAGYSETDFWTFPNGTVIVKNFDLVINENTNETRRLETRILIRYVANNGTPAIRGASYRWRADNSEADLVNPAGSGDVIEANIEVVRTSGPPTLQNWLYPRPAQCLQCHNVPAGLVLGPKTAQLNRDYTYPSPGQIDNQLHTWNQLGMLDPPLPDQHSYPNLPKMADLKDSSATIETRVRSYIASNCSHCHRPNGPGPYFDMRYDTENIATGMFTADIDPFGVGLVRDSIATSRMYIRDAIRVAGPTTNFQGPMPPLARDVPDQRILNLYNQWVNFDYDVMSATRVSSTQVRLLFNRPLHAASAALAGNYQLDNDATVSQAVVDTDPAAVVLTTSPLAASTTYTVTINRVRELQAPQNPIFPNTTVTFTTPGPVAPDAPTLTVAAAGDGSAQLSFTAPASNGGAAITGYTGDCAGPLTVSGSSASSPMTISGLINGITYSCRVRAINSAGTGDASNALNVTPMAPVPMLVGVYSRKLHGGTVAHDLLLNRAAVIAGSDITVEPRIAGSGHQIVFRFNMRITSAGTAASTIGSATTSLDGKDVIVTLNGIGNGQRTTVSLSNVSNTGLNVTTSLGFLVGDVNGSRGVNAMDISAIKSRSAQPTTASNFIYDINLSGNIGAADVSAIKSRMNGTLP